MINERTVKILNKMYTILLSFTCAYIEVANICQEFFFGTASKLCKLYRKIPEASQNKTVSLTPFQSK